MDRSPPSRWRRRLQVTLVFGVGLVGVHRWALPAAVHAVIAHHLASHGVSDVSFDVERVGFSAVELGSVRVGGSMSARRVVVSFRLGTLIRGRIDELHVQDCTVKTSRAAEPGAIANLKIPKRIPVGGFRIDRCQLGPLTDVVAAFQVDHGRLRGVAVTAQLGTTQVTANSTTPDQFEVCGDGGWSGMRVAVCGRLPSDLQELVSVADVDITWQVGDAAQTSSIRGQPVALVAGGRGVAEIRGLVAPRLRIVDGHLTAQVLSLEQGGLLVKDAHVEGSLSGTVLPGKVDVTLTGKVAASRIGWGKSVVHHDVRGPLQVRVVGAPSSPDIIAPIDLRSRRTQIRTGGAPVIVRNLRVRRPLGSLRALRSGGKIRLRSGVLKWGEVSIPQARGSLDVSQSGISVSARLPVSATSKVALRYRLSHGKGLLKVSLPSTRFRKHDIGSRVFHTLTGANIRGTVSADFTVGQGRSGGTIRFADTDMHLANGALLSGVRGRVTVDGWAPVDVKTEGPLRWRGARSSTGVTVGGGQANVHVRGDVFRVTDLHFAFAGGRVRAKPVYGRLSQQNHIFLSGHGLSLEKLLPPKWKRRIRARGTVAGSLAVRVTPSDGDASLSHARLVSTGRGRIRISQTEWLGRALEGEGMTAGIRRRVASAFTHLAYERLTIDLFERGVAPEMRIAVAGRGVDVNQDVSLDVNVRGLRRALASINHYRGVH